MFSARQSRILRIPQPPGETMNQPKFILLVAPGGANRSRNDGAKSRGLTTCRNNIPDCHREIGYNSRLTRHTTGLVSRPNDRVKIRHHQTREHS